MLAGNAAEHGLSGVQGESHEATEDRWIEELAIGIHGLGNPPLPPTLTPPPGERGESLEGFSNREIKALRMETMLSSMSLPSNTRSFLHARLATRASRQAAHSVHEP
jgi:hypothetical protein